MRFPNFVELATVVMGRLEDGCGYRDFRPRCVCIRTFLKRAKDAAPKHGRSVIYLITGGGRLAAMCSRRFIENLVLLWFAFLRQPTITATNPEVRSTRLEVVCGARSTAPISVINTVTTPVTARGSSSDCAWLRPIAEHRFCVAWRNLANARAL
jgi:hypothetical protein